MASAVPHGSRPPGRTALPEAARDKAPSCAPGSRPVSAASAASRVSSWSSVQSAKPAARTVPTAVPRTPGEAVPPAASTASVTVCTASRSIAEKRVVVGWSSASSAKWPRQAEHSTTGPAVPRGSSGTPRTVRRRRPVRRR